MARSKSAPAMKKRRLIRGAETPPSPDAQATVRAGAWLRFLRLKRGLSQHQLAEAIGLKRYSAISHFENGRAHLQPVHFEKCAIALEMEPRHFVKQLLSFYAPDIYNILFGDASASARRA